MCWTILNEWAMFDNFNDYGFVSIKSRMSKLWFPFYDSYLSLRGTLSLNLPISSSLKNCVKNAALFSLASNCQYFLRHIYLKSRNLIHPRHFCGSVSEVAFHHLPKLFHFLIFETHLKAMFFISKRSYEYPVLRLFQFPFYKWHFFFVFAAFVPEIKMGCVSHQIFNFLQIWEA